MGMPVTVELASEMADTSGAAGARGDATADATDIAAVFEYFSYIDQKFSTYKPASEIMRINRGETVARDWSDDMALIFGLAEDTKQRTGGFFDIRRPGASGADGAPFYDPSGIVKGWAIFQAVKLLESRGRKNFYIDAGGDIQTNGANGLRADGVEKPWTIGIKNPLKENEIVKTIYARGHDGAGTGGIGVATSGTYIRGEHIYNPHETKTADSAAQRKPSQILSLTVVGPNVYEADRFATAAFAMGAAGIHFIESLPGLEGYMIDKNGIATMTTGFKQFLISEK